MPRRDRTRAALEKLTADTAEPRSERARVALQAALERKTPLVVHAAASVIRAHALAGFETRLRRAFERATQHPVRADPGCRVKLAIVRALDTLDVEASDVFLAGARHVQREPVWGGTVDTAAELRGASALALVRAGHEQAVLELAVLLADPEREARLAAADALVVSGDAHAGVPLLLHRVTSGDPSPEVLGACCLALLTLAPDVMLERVVSWLTDDDEALVEAAALALGQHRHPEALSPLRALVERQLGPKRAVAMLAIAMLRSDAAWDYLIAQIAEGTDAEARDAGKALAVYRDQPGLAERVRAAIGDQPARHELLAEAFSS